MEPENKQEQEEANILPAEAGIVILCSYFFTIIPGIFILSFSPAAVENGEINSFWSKISLVIGEAGLILFPLIYLRTRDISPIKVFRLNKIPTSIAKMSALLGVGLTILVDEVGRIIQLILPEGIDWLHNLDVTMKAESGLELFLLVLGAIFLAAIVEEIIFRGLLQQSIEKNIDVTKAVIYSSLIWTFLHFNPYFALQTFLYGFFLGYIVWRSNSIFPAIICHGINNLFAVVFYNTDFDALFPFYEWQGHVSPIILALAAFAAYRGIIYIMHYYQELNSPSSANSASGE